MRIWILGGFVVFSMALGGCTGTADTPRRSVVGLDLSGSTPLTSKEIEDFRASLRASRREYVEKFVAPGPLQARAFWTVYEAYVGEMTLIGDEAVRVFTTYRDNRSTLTPEAAQELARRLLENTKAADATIGKYYAKVAAATNAEVASRFLVTETRLQSILNANLTAMLPAPGMQDR